MQTAYAFATKNKLPGFAFFRLVLYLRRYIYDCFMEPFFSVFGRLHMLFALLTFLGVLLLVVRLVKFASKETLTKVVTWFLIIGIVGSIATMIAAHMMGAQDGGWHNEGRARLGMNRGVMSGKMLPGYPANHRMPMTGGVMPMMQQ